MIVRLAAGGPPLTRLRVTLATAAARRASASRTRVPARVTLGARVPAGHYVVRATARDASGGTLVATRRVRLR